MDMPGHYDVIVLGAGPGGYVAAIRAAQLGKRVAIVESKYWGGVCLNVGCIPSKALLRNADLAHTVQHEAKTFGIQIDGSVTFDFKAAFQRSRSVADGRVKGVHFLMKKNGIDELNGWGSFVDAHTLTVKLNDGGEDTVTFDNAIIAAGATTRLLPGTTLSERVVTYEEQIMTSELPKSIIIAARCHRHRVRLRAQQLRRRRHDRRVPRPHPPPRGRGRLRRAHQAVQEGRDQDPHRHPRGLDRRRLRPGPRHRHQRRHAAGARDRQGHAGHRFRRPHQGYGLENTGVALTERGAIEVDDHLRTNVPGIYAIGDVTSKLMLAHVAESQGIIAAETIAAPRP